MNGLRITWLGLALLCCILGYLVFQSLHKILPTTYYGCGQPKSLNYGIPNTGTSVTFNCVQQP